MRNLVIRAGLVGVLLVSALSLTACGSDDADDSSGTGGSSATGGSSSGTGGSDATGGTDAGTGGSDTATGGSDAGTGGSEGGGDVTDAGSCDTDVVSPNTIPETQKTGTYPEAAGGTPVDGIYYLSEFDVYAPAGADEHVRARALIISGDKLTSVNVDDGGIAQVVAGTFTASGSTASFEVSCPGAQTGSFEFTASATEFWIHDPEEPNVQIYTKQ